MRNTDLKESLIISLVTGFITGFIFGGLLIGGALVI